MTPVQTTPIRERAAEGTHPGRDERPVILTRSEIAECNCPDHCDRDHEND